MDLSHTIVVMNEGKVVQVGAPQDIYDRPATPFVASFMGGANVFRRQTPADGAAVDSFAFVRPHDIKLTRAQEGDGARGGADVTLARVERLSFLGAYVKVALRLPDGAALAVELSPAELEALGLREGDRVLADLQETRLFVGDYSI